MFDILGVTVLVVLAALFGWVAMRARRAKNKIIRWTGLILAGLLTVVFTAGLAVALVGFYRLNIPPYHYPVAAVTIAATPEQLARGERLSRLFCPACHSPTGKPPLAGQGPLKGGPPVGALYIPNLTPAGELKNWSDGEVIRAIREGIHQSGRPLVIMPSEVFRNLSDADVQALVAYLRSQPAAGPTTPPPRLNVLAALLIGAGVFHTSAQPPIAHPILAPAEGTSAEYGRYLVAIMGCPLCHGDNLAGRTGGRSGPPPGPNLTQLVPRWNEGDFIHTLRTGIDPYNHTLAEGMPWKDISAFASDEDLKAIYAYVHGLTPIQTPSK
jgi:mono/diheme cytochrome c family protein